MWEYVCEKEGDSVTKKIDMKKSIVEIDGDEMAGVMWTMVKDKLLLPYVNLKTEYYNLGLTKRDETEDQITIQAAEAIQRHGVGVKCATITPNADRVKEYNLKNQLQSPNGTIRAILDGTVFRKPIILKNIKPAIGFWKKPIIIGRHAYGDVYKNVEYRIEEKGVAELVFKPEGRREVRLTVKKFCEPGVIQAIHNRDSSIENFARTCFAYTLDQKVDMWFAAKDTISKTYDARFKEIFHDVYESEYKEKFAKAGLKYFYTLIDDAIARVVRSEGGFLWACKNYDGDIMSDFLGAAYGSLAILTSVLVSPNGNFEYEAAHGTVQKHYYRYLKGEKTSTNPIAIIFAWTGALRKRGELDKTPDLTEFADRLELAVERTVEIEETMTGDLAKISNPRPRKIATTEEFIEAVGKSFEKLKVE